jgi:hypothetical protein
LGAIVIAGGAILGTMAIASMNVAADQLGDPFVGDVSKHTIRYLIIAAMALFSGVIITVIGSPHAANPTR